MSVHVVPIPVACEAWPTRTQERIRERLQTLSEVLGLFQWQALNLLVSVAFRPHVRAHVGDYVVTVWHHEAAVYQSTSFQEYLFESKDDPVPPIISGVRQAARRCVERVLQIQTKAGGTP